MALGKLWAGKIFGTNTGNIFVKLKGDDDALTGTLHVNEDGLGLYAYDITGSFDGARLSLSGKLEKEVEGAVFGELRATADLTPRGDLDGEWETNIGSAGVLALFPHDRSDSPASADKIPDQLHTARHLFGAIEIDLNQIIALADDIQKDFTRGRVVVTVIAGTEQSRFLQDFKKLKFNRDRADLIKIFAQEPEVEGIRRVVSIEFGQQFNEAMAQGASEAWVLGKLEKLKEELKRFEQNYTTNIKRWGVGFNQLLILGVLVFLPSLSNLRDRTILMVGVLLLVATVNWLHNRYLPLAAIYLTKKSTGLLARISPTAISWIITVTAGVAAILLAGYLQGWMLLPYSL